MPTVTLVAAAIWQKTIREMIWSLISGFGAWYEKLQAAIPNSEYAKVDDEQGRKSYAEEIQIMGRFFSSEDGQRRNWYKIEAKS